MSLSDKGVGCKCKICLEKGSIINYSQKNVKKAVQELKEDIRVWTTEEYFNKINKIIDKIFGDSLTGERVK